MPVSSAMLRSARLVSAGRLHEDGAVTDVISLSDKLCSAGSDEMASRAPLKHVCMLEQSMRNDVSAVQLANPNGKLATALTFPFLEGS